MTRLKNRLKREFATLYKEISHLLLKFVLKKTGGDLEQAEEIVQDTLLSAYKSFRKFEHKSTFFTWICKIALYKVADFYKEKIHTNSHLVVPGIEILNTLVDPQLSNEEKAALEDLVIKLRQCLDLLPEEYKRILELRYFEGLKSREIALALGISDRALEGKLYRARTNLKEVILQKHPDLEKY